MAKKSRRVRRKGARPRLSKAQLAQPTQVTIREVPSEEEPKAIESARKPEVIDFRQEYHYVVKDLQRIGILAAAMLGGLIILSFIL